MADDIVNNPKHYTFGGIEVIDAIEAWELDKDFYLANALKYIVRSKHKGSELTDLQKAVFYLNRKILRLTEKKT